MEIIGLFVLVSTFTFFILGFLLQNRNIRKNGEYADAIVVKTTKRPMRRGHTYYPVLKYTVDGRTYEVEYNVGNTHPKYNDGETVKIVYHKKKVEWIVIV